MMNRATYNKRYQHSPGVCGVARIPVGGRSCRSSTPVKKCTRSNLKFPMTLQERFGSVFDGILDPDPDPDPDPGSLKNNKILRWTKIIF